MIKFDINKLVVEHHKIRSIGLALGGSISILDEKKTAETGKEKFYREYVPLSVARAFQVKYKISKFMSPAEVAVVRYDGQIVAVELHPLGERGQREIEGLFGTRVWVSNCERNINTVLKPALDENYYVDGSYVYQLPADIQSVINDPKCASLLSQDTRFRTLSVVGYKLANLNMGENEKTTKLTNLFEQSSRSIAVFVANNGQVAISPPIWKDISSIGDSKLKRTDRSDDEIKTEKYRFNTIDQYFDVNLNFALHAGKVLSETFGYYTIEPLQLPQLMVTLKTVNLPNVPPSIKSTFCIGLKFTHAMAWLLGLMSTCKTFEQVVAVRSCMKYLTAKGLFRKEIFDHKHIYRNGYGHESIDLLTRAEALETADSKWGAEYIANKVDTNTDRSIGYNGFVI